MHSGKFSLTPKNQVKDTDSSLPDNHDSSLQDPICVSSSSSEDKNDQSNNEVSNQLVLYDPAKNGNNTIELVPDPLQCEPPLRPKNRPSSSTPRILPAVGAFTVQCASCFKWRLIPTKEKYEEIREHILEQPFVCEKAREWRPDVSCDDPEDISQDGSRVWAIDKPSIAQPPAGWQRLLRIRGEGSTKFADIYYEAPSGKRLRSMVEVQKFLMDHPEYMESGVSLSRFSFQVPKPLQENYVRKRSAPRLTGPVEPQQASPLAWVSPDESQERIPELPGSHIEPHVSDPDSRPTKKQATRRTVQKDAV